MNTCGRLFATACLAAASHSAHASSQLYMVIDLAKGADTGKFPVTYLEAEPSSGWTDEFKGDKLVLRRIEAGTFNMGSPENEIGHEYRSTPGSETLHTVTLSKPFYIGVFEVTQRQYTLITGKNPAVFKGDFRPVDKVSYGDIRGKANGSSFPEHSQVDADSFLGALRAKTDLNFDLPTEAEWEYACRAGTTTALNSGYNLENYVISYNLVRLGRYIFNQDDGKGGYTNGTTTVGSYEPNRWGLYDMHGNVAEWCLDWWEVQTDKQVTDPVGPGTGTCRVARGGFFGGSYYWFGIAAAARSAFRADSYIKPLTPDSRLAYFGFRIAIQAD